MSSCRATNANRATRRAAMPALGYRFSWAPASEAQRAFDLCFRVTQGRIAGNAAAA